MTRILVVEGSHHRPGLIAERLRQAHFEVVCSASANDAAALANAEDFGLVITDWTLPDGSGLDLCRRLTNAARPLPVLLNASLNDATEVLDGLAAGAAGYIADDLPVEALVTRVQNVIESGFVHNGLMTSGNGESGHDISLNVHGRDFQLKATREQLLSVLVSTLDDLARANRRHARELERRRDAEQKLRDSEALYESLVETLPMNLYRKDRAGRVTFTNRRYCQLRGTSPAEMLGLTDYDMFPKELADKYTADDRQVMETGDVFETTESHITPNGEKRYAHVLKARVVDASGRVVGTQGIFWDVTAKHRAEEALNRERLLLRALMDNLPDNIFFKDSAGRYLRVNRAMAERLGVRDPSEAVGKNAEDFFPPEYASRIRATDDFVLRTGQSVIGQEELVKWSDGSERWVLITRMPWFDENGHITGCFGVSHNITDQKRAQQAMREARDAAQAASAAKSNFLANMSHEIRTPMNAIIGMTELVLDTPLTPTQRDYLSMVQESGEALLGVINDILDFSKIEAGKMELDNRPFQLREVVGDTLKALGFRANRDQLELTHHLEVDVPEFLIGDALRLRQIVVNLVGNAIKFTERGEIVLDASLAKEDDVLIAPTSAPDAKPRIALHFSVRDTGIGIPRDKLTKIFDAFEQADNTMARRFEGTGLGLAITSRLVEMMQGRIWVESEIGKGSIFHFTAVFELSDIANAGPQINTTSLAGRRVLVVDDNATNRRILEEILHNWLMVPTMADGAVSAIRELEQAIADERPFDLILTDANMPEVDGFMLIEELRKRPHLSRNVIMMLTSGGHANDLARCSTLNIASYLLKPVKQSELFDAIVDVLGVSDVEDDKSDHPDRFSKHSRELNVLLAEDSKVNQKLALALLQKWGHRVTVANNGLEAVKAVEQEQFDVVLMDVQMPECDGLQATQLIRQQEQQTQTHVPIIAMTAHALKGDEERCLASGMDAYLTKPIRAPLLFGKLTEICGATPTDILNVVAIPLVSRATEASSPATSAVPESPLADPNPASQLIDWPAALEVTGHDNDLLREICEAVLEECPRLFQQLDAAISSNNSDTAHRAAHTILGNMRALSAVTVMDQAAIVEALAKNSDFAALSAPVEQLRHLAEQTYAEIRRRFS